MFASRSFRLAASLLVVAALGCEHQPLEPIRAFSAAASGGGGGGPAAPSGTAALAVSFDQVDVSWSDNAMDEGGFEVYRSTTGATGAFTRLATTGVNIAAYSDIGLNASTEYCYEVRAFRSLGAKLKYSAFSPRVCATTSVATPPPTPGRLYAETYPWQIIVWWSAATLIGTDGFIIERCQGTECADSDFTVIDVTQSTYYSDYYAGQGLTYTYRVRAYNSAGQSAPSNEASALMCVVGVSDDGTYICIDP